MATLVRLWLFGLLVWGCASGPSAPPNPVGSLANVVPNGVLVTWLTTRILEPLPTEGIQVETNGTGARASVEKRGSCAAIRGDETISVLVPMGQPLSNVGFVACLRGPHLDAAETAVLSC
jgi:hypothetical protein